MKHTLKVLGSGFIVYGAMAACSAASVDNREGRGPVVRSPGGTGAQLAQGGQLMTSGGQLGQAGSLGQGGRGSLDSPSTTGGQSPAPIVGSGSGSMPGMLDPVPPANAQVSGTRIKAKWNVSEDGFREFAGRFDSQLQLECFFAPDSQGELRCLPTAALSASSNQAYFQDSGCTLPLFVAAASACVSAGVGAYGHNVVSGCAPRYSVFALTSVAPAKTWVKSAAACIEQAPNPGLRYYTGTVVPDAMFARAQVVVD